MSGGDHIGSRIREKRIQLRIRQSQLAKIVGVSPSYLNLIEHNRRRIGGKLLTNLADVLSIDVDLLSDDGKSAKVARLEEAAHYHKADMQAESARELATRFPAWSNFLIDLDRNVRSLEAKIDALSDRLSHDPQLASSLHEVITTVTAIRATSSILSDSDDIGPMWQMRFQRNISEDSLRLAEEAQALVDYLDADETEARTGTPHEEVEAFLHENDYYFEMIESETPDLEEILNISSIRSTAGLLLARNALETYQADATALPFSSLSDDLPIQVGLSQLAQKHSCSIPQLMRRLACLPTDVVGREFGMVSMDVTGSILFRKQIDGFHMPRFGSACAYWPIFQALQMPMRLLEDIVIHTGREGGTFHTYSYCEAIQDSIGRPPRLVAHMLFYPHTREAAQATRVGATCRVCAIAACPSRREPSILGEEL
jgi:transcriptional regulator with XRE-family HTH domain